tara:strand:+ start:1076 stop:1495 length:420 start_codon:yes stop_codon:yes gene_type:complete
MNIANIKLPIAVIGVIVAQAFGIIWYVASLDGTVRNLDESVSTMQEQATTIDIAVLQTDLENIKEKIIMMDEMHSEKFDPTELEESIEELEEAINELEKMDVLMENEMRTIMSDHENIGKALEDLGKGSYSENREYGDY